MVWFGKDVAELYKLRTGAESIVAFILLLRPALRTMMQLTINKIGQLVQPYRLGQN